MSIMNIYERFSMPHYQKQKPLPAHGEGQFLASTPGLAVDVSTRKIQQSEKVLILYLTTLIWKRP